MKHLLFIGSFLTASICTSAQFVYKIKADSVLITNDSCTAELIIENSTKDIKGFLYNRGKGRTEFQKALVKINDSIYTVGGDTLKFSSPGLYVHLTGDESIAGIKTFTAKQLNLSTSSSSILGDGVFLRAIDTRTSGDHRIAGFSAINNTVIGQFLVATSVTYAPFNSQDGLYIRNYTGGSAIYMTTSNNSFVEAKSFSLTLDKVGIGYNHTLGSGAVGGTYGGQPVVIGYEAKGPGVAVGYKSEATHAQATAIGPQAKASGPATIAIGNGAWAIPSTSNGNQIVLGDAAFAYKNMNYFIGGGAGINHDYVVCFGCAGSSVSRTRDVSSAEHQGFLGWYSDTLHSAFQNGDGFINDWWLGGPIETANPHDITLNITNGLGTNKDGVDFTINASKGTGTGTPGKILFTAANATTSGSTLQTANTVLTATGAGVATGAFSPAASLHLAAGTTSANTAPLKFTSGTNLSTPENGAVEYDGTNYFATSGGTRYTLAKTLTATSTLDFSSTSAQSSADLTITVTGAADGDVVNLGIPNSAINANSTYTAWVSASNTVTVRFNNYSSGSIDPASASFRVSVTKY